MKLADLEGEQFLKEGWDDLKGEHVHSYVVSEENHWTAEQVGSSSLRPLSIRVLVRGFTNV